MTERPGQRRDSGNRLVTGTIPAAKAAAARTLLASAGLAIEVIDDVTWRVGACTFYPASGLWTDPAGQQGYGAVSLKQHLLRPAPPL